MSTVGRLVSLLGGLVISLAIYPAFSHDQREAEFDEQAALNVSQAAVGQPVSNHQFSDGHIVQLDDFRGQPILINLIYTSCYHTCPTLTNHLASTVRIALDALGADSFSVLTIGFDATHDTPERMQQFAEDRGIKLPNWKFLSTDHRTIDALSQELGFRYFASPKGFDHTIQTTILDGDGRVFRQVYGSSFDSPQLVEPLKELVFGARANSTSVSGWVNGVRLFCTVYDPSSGRYRFDYSLFVAIGVGLVSLGAVAAFIVRGWRDHKSFGSTT